MVCDTQCQMLKMFDDRGLLSSVCITVAVVQNSSCGFCNVNVHLVYKQYLEVDKLSFQNVRGG